MKPCARLFLWRVIWFTVLFAGTIVYAAAFPDRPVQIVVGVAPGGGVDRAARLLATGLAEKWGQPVIVVNKPAAGGVIATEYVAQAPANGLTLLYTGSTFTITPFEIKVRYDPIGDFTPITRLGEYASVLLVNHTVPARTLKELVALAKDKPGQLNFSSSGGGSPTYLQMVLLMKYAGFNMTNIQYRGGGEAAQALLKGEVQATFLAGSARAMLQTGNVRALAVTSDRRVAAYPDVPTIAEALGIGRYEGTNAWHGLLAPKGTSGAIADVVRNAAVEVINSPSFQKAVVMDAFVTIGSTPKDFGDFLRADYAKWASLPKGNAAR